MGKYIGDDIKRFIFWFGLAIPAIITWVGAFLCITLSFAGQATDVQTVLTWLGIIFIFANALAMFRNEIVRNSNGKETHVREIIRERERVIEPDYDDAPELDSWMDHETEFGIESRRLRTELEPSQVVAHLKVNPPTSTAQVDYLIGKYKKYKSIRLYLLNVRKELQSEENEDAIREGDSSGERMIKKDNNRSPRFDLPIRKRAYV